uniref:Uncharacterized protein n=1 Tax=viral metagenome TaxID=1070528 RepID=A0A6C0DZM8_9ZZZZ
MKNFIDIFFKREGLYNKQLQFLYIVIFFFIILLLITTFPTTYGFVVLIIAFSLYISDSLIEVPLQENIDLNKTLLNKLQEIQLLVVRQKRDTKLKVSSKRPTLDYLYLDTNLIVFLHSIIPLHQFNKDEFYKLLIGTNNILRLRGEIETYYKANKSYPQNIAQMFQDAIDLKTKVLNNMHNFIYSVPKTNIMYNYVDETTDRYNVLITKNLDKIHVYYKNSFKKTGFTNNSIVINYKTTKPFDPDNDTNIIKPMYFYN